MNQEKKFFVEELQRKAGLASENKKMNKYILIGILSLGLFTNNSFSQDTQNTNRYTAKNKGKFFVFWGGNRENYSKSDINFKGKDYDFTIYDVTAQDKPMGWHIDYINPAQMTIPQTNFKLGYYISDHYNISIGFDHMKYVMNQNQRVKYSGSYSNAGSYNEQPIGNELTLSEDFLRFEHTDGLNFVYAEIARVDDISNIFKIKNTDKIQVNLTEGIGGGFLYPRTDTTLLSKKSHDEFNVAGYGISAKVGLNITFFKYFFVQTELKGGYINMPNIRTTYDSSDSASQSFFFLQRIIAFGGIFRI